MFYALAVTVKRSVDQLFMHYFHNFLEGQTVSFSSFVVLACVLRVTTKKRQLSWRKIVYPEKILATPLNLPTPVKNTAGAHAYVTVTTLFMVIRCALSGCFQSTL